MPLSSSLVPDMKYGFMEAVDLSMRPEHRQRFERMKTELDGWMRSVIRSLNGGDYAFTEKFEQEKGS